MGKIWVHIEPVISPDGDEAKGALTDSLKELLSAALVTRITAALPAEKFSTAAGDKPIKSTDAYNAIKVVGRFQMKIEMQGSKMTLTTQLRLDFEAIRAPSTAAGNLIASGSKGAAVENRGTGEKAILRNAEDALDAIAGPLVKQIMVNPNFKSYGQKMGLPL
jgi:hypothetical protein